MAGLSNFMPSAKPHISIRDPHLLIGGVDTVALARNLERRCTQPMNNVCVRTSACSREAFPNADIYYTAKKRMLPAIEPGDVIAVLDSR